MEQLVRRAIILAGGKGTRLYPVTLETPKPLLTINKKPIINYLIEMFGGYGVQEIVIVIRPSDQEDFRWWEKRWKDKLPSIDFRFFVEDEPMGTLGSWAHKLYEWTGSEPFFLTNGDELKEINLSELTERHREAKALVTIAAVSVPNPSEYGVLVLDGGNICDFLEKPKNPPCNLISSGLYLIDPAARDYLKEPIFKREKFLMIEKDLFPQLAKIGKLAAYKSNGKWFDCGNIQRWEKAIKEWDTKL